MAKKKASAKKKQAKSPKKNSLVANINRRKKAGTSRSKTESTISPEAYKDMQSGWGKKGKKKSAKKSASPSRRKAAKRKKSSKKE